MEYTQRSTRSRTALKMQGSKENSNSATIKTTTENPSIVKRTYSSKQPSNSQQSSQQSDQMLSEVAFVEPLDYGKDIPNHPAVLGRAFYEAGFRKAKEIKKIGKFRYRIDLETKEDYRLLQRIDLRQMNLKLFVPGAQKETTCFVAGVPLDFGEEELLQNTAAVTGEKIKKVERMKRKDQEGNLINTENLKILVEGKKVPRAFKIFSAPFKASLFIFPVRQCQGCWKYGHSTVKCRSKRSCQNCGELHDQATNECPNQPKCINCKKDHGAASKNCPERRRRQQLVERKKEECSQYSEDYVTTSNMFDGLEEDFGDDGVQSIHDTFWKPGDRTYGRSKSRLTGMQRRRASERSESRQSARSYARVVKEGPRADPKQRFLGNPHKTTEFEGLISQLRKDFLRLFFEKSWLCQIIQLRDKIKKTVENHPASFNTDHMLIEVYSELDRIIQAETENIEENPRIVEATKNGA